MARAGGGAGASEQPRPAPVLHWRVGELGIAKGEWSPLAYVGQFIVTWLVGSPSRLISGRCSMRRGIETKRQFLRAGIHFVPRGRVLFQID
jgi:hypothetical protein